MTEELARDAVADPSYFGTLMVQTGAADGMVSGRGAHDRATRSGPPSRSSRRAQGVSVVSSVFFMCLADRVLVYGDCAVNPKPDSGPARRHRRSAPPRRPPSFGIEPRIAMLSYSTGESGAGADVDAVARGDGGRPRARPDLKVEGPIQYDAAVDAAVAKLKLPDSDVAGNATVFVFPDLDTGNVAYKAVQRSANAVADRAGAPGAPQAGERPSRGCTVTDIVNTVAITAIQAQGTPAGAATAAAAAAG